MRKYTLEITAFIAGGVVMILEIIGSRILAPFLGTSIYVWSSLIGIILASLSLGYWWGGKLADKDPQYKTLSKLIFASAFFVGLTIVLKTPILLLSSIYITDVRIGSLIAVFLLFAPATAALGAITPYIIKLKVKELTTTGATTGNIFAISTIGSIAGTLATGFILISLLGSTKILLSLLFVLLATSFLVYPKKPWRNRVFFLILAVLLSSSYLIIPSDITDIIIEKDTRYSHVVIFDNIDEKTGRPTRNLVTDAGGIQSKIFLDNEYEIPTTYINYFRLVKHFNPSLKRVLMLGGGAYSFANTFLYENPDATLDVVEIDGELTNLAREHFGLKDSPRLTIYHDEARRFINATENKYDAVVVDVFFSLAIPHQLTTVEAIGELDKLLTKDGVVILNLISSVNDDGGKFLRAEYHTYKEIFPQVYLLATKDPNDGEKFQNFIMVALKNNEEPKFKSINQDFNNYLANLWQRDIQNDMPILTDDFAPVEQYLISNLKKLSSHYTFSDQ